MTRESFYEVGQPHVAQHMRSAIALECIATADPMLPLRVLEVYELARLDFAEA